MSRAMLSGVLALTLSAGSTAFASDDEDATSTYVSATACPTVAEWTECEAEERFVQRLFNFRPWTVESRSLHSVGTPGLPRGRRYYGGRYFGQFNNRFYGPQYGNF